MSFTLPLILIGIIPSLILWWYFGRQTIGYNPMNSLMQRYGTLPFPILFLRSIEILGICILWIILAGPYSTSLIPIQKDTGESIMLALDISKSMLADDITPNRLEKAKEVLIHFLERPSSYKIGFSIFAGKTFVLSPPTHDLRGLQNIIQNITTDTIRQTLPGLSGTNIGDALLASQSALSGSTNEKIIVLVTDGRANIGTDPLIVTPLLRDLGIRTYTIGIGGSGTTLLSYRDTQGVRQYFYDEKGEKLRADIDITMLTDIARETGAISYMADNATLLEDIFREIREKTEKPIEYIHEKKHLSYIPIFLFLLMILGLLRWMILWILRKK